MRFVTAGESHGRCLTAVLEGMPAGVPVVEDDINKELTRRQKGFGRGERMQSIETDRVVITSGVRWGETLGSPITLVINNKDWENTKRLLSVDAEDKDPETIMVHPRPGHADLVGLLKYNRKDVRDILERASARETTARVAVGAVCKSLLREFGITIVSFVSEIGPVKSKVVTWDPAKIVELAEASPVRCMDKEAEAKMIKEIEAAKAEGDTLGGVWTVVAFGCPVGLGSHTQWDKKLDGRLARALLSIQAMKGVEFGMGFGAARVRGSEVHDELFYDSARGFHRGRNNAGGLEGGMTTGEPLVIRVAKKPLSSLRKPLRSVNLKTLGPHTADLVRSDVCAVPSACVIGEAAVAFELAYAMQEKFGGDSLTEMKRNFEGYQEYIRNWKLNV